MGCLNSNGNFSHWFGNIHLSGPCNRSCYFCIGQHMMSLDRLNTLDAWPLPGLDEFIDACNAKRIREVNLTGSNTDPLLYRHHEKLIPYLRARMPGVVLGIRTNGVQEMHPAWQLYDKGSVSIPTFNPVLYRKIMGQGDPPDVSEIIHNFGKPLKFQRGLMPGGEPRCLAASPRRYCTPV